MAPKIKKKKLALPIDNDGSGVEEKPKSKTVKTKGILKPAKTKLALPIDSDGSGAEEEPKSRKVAAKPKTVKPKGILKSAKNKLVLPIDSGGDDSESEELEVERKSKKLVARAEEDE